MLLTFENFCSGASGQLGNNSTSNQLVAVQVAGLLARPWRQTIKHVSCGAYHTAVVSDDGRIFVWGSGGLGQLGLGNNEGKPVPAEVGGVLSDKRLTERRVVDLSCGAYHTAACTEDGRIFTWGLGGRLRFSKLSFPDK